MCRDAGSKPGPENTSTASLHSSVWPESVESHAAPCSSSLASIPSEIRGQSSELRDRLVERVEVGGGAARRRPHEGCSSLRRDERNASRADNVLLFGLPGVGKRHLACALGHALVEAGRSVLFTPTHQLVQTLLAVRRDLLLPKTLRTLDVFDAVILDDLGYVQQTA
ncbi:MAG: ATP-binding protein, partial [Myxococcales bacterium]|nr:ATP-binding protein [Myxococcales bacterium]